MTFALDKTLVQTVVVQPFTGANPKGGGETYGPTEFYNCRQEQGNRDVKKPSGETVVSESFLIIEASLATVGQDRMLDKFILPNGKSPDIIKLQDVIDIKTGEIDHWEAWF